MAMDEALTRALGGEDGPLFGLLARGSGLPGIRINLALAEAFADACASAPRGPELARRMASASADAAPGGSPLEMIPVAGVLAAGACAARQPKARAAMLEVLHDACDDLRFRVREAVPLAIARLGEGVLGDLEPFMDGYFHAAAVLAALGRMNPLTDGAGVASLLGKALALVNDAPRSATRWPGYKALLEAIEQAIAPLTLRVGADALDVLAGFRSSDPHLRALLVRALDDRRLVTRFGADHQRALEALRAQDKGPRDPRGAPRPTRKRGGGRRR